MMLVNQIDNLIEAGWRVIESDYDEEAFHEWRKRAHECLTALLGSDHAYTEHFARCLERAERTNALSGVGVLSAAAMAQLQNGVGATADRSGNGAYTNHERSDGAGIGVSSRSWQGTVAEPWPEEGCALRCWALNRSEFPFDTGVGGPA